MEYDEKGRAVKEKKDWDGQISKITYDPESGEIISEKKQDKKRAKFWTDYLKGKVLVV